VVGGGLEYVILFLDENDAEIDISGNENVHNRIRYRYLKSAGSYY